MEDTTFMCCNIRCQCEKNAPYPKKELIQSCVAYLECNCIWIVMQPSRMWMVCVISHIPIKCLSNSKKTGWRWASKRWNISNWRSYIYNTISNLWLLSIAIPETLFCTLEQCFYFLRDAAVVRLNVARIASQYVNI